MLETKFPHSAYIRSEAFQRMRARFEAEARDAVTGSATQADDLNDLAWMLAINGADLGKADECVEKAIATLGTINQTLAPAEVKRRLAVYKDTLGYILLQMDIDQPSDATLKKAADLLKEAGEINDDEETFFKHAVAAFALGDKSAALTELRISVGERRYRPSHELLMLRPFLHDEFSAELAGLLRIDEKKAVDRQRDSR